MDLRHYVLTIVAGLGLWLTGLAFFESPFIIVLTTLLGVALMIGAVIRFMR